MEGIKSDISVSRNKKSEKVLLILLVVFIVLLPILFVLRKKFSMIPVYLIWLFIFIDMVRLVILSRKYYNWIFIFLFIIITGFYLRSVRLPREPFFWIGFSGLACISLYSSYFFLKNYDKNAFLKYIGFSSGIMLFLVTLGFWWKIMHWPMAGVFFSTGMILYVPFLFAFVFTLPASNYINWSKSDRAIFSRAIIIPIVFIYILCILLFVLSDVWINLLRYPLIPFGMGHIDLLNKPGL
jgi:hypothetical protein